MLTPNDISNKRFEKSPFGGYKPEEVDSFLSEIAISYEKLYEAKEAAEEKMEVLAEKLEEYRANEDSLRTVLLGAQKLGDNIIRDSKAKAEVIISDAEGQVKQVFSESEGKINKERETLANLQKETAEFKSGIMVLPVEYTKGLEFDAVVLYHPTKEHYPMDNGHAKLLYVAATRALHELAVVHTEDVSELL